MTIHPRVFVNFTRDRNLKIQFTGEALGIYGALQEMQEPSTKEILSGLQKAWSETGALLVQIQGERKVFQVDTQGELYDWCEQPFMPT